MKKQHIVLGLMTLVAAAASVAPAWAIPADTISVPEPASLLLYGAGAGAVLLFRRLRARRD